MAETTQSASRPLELTELLTLMVEVSERVNSTLDLDELMARIAAIIKRAIDFEVFAILLQRENAGVERTLQHRSPGGAGAGSADQGG